MDEVAAIAREGEPDRYLAALLAPAPEREALLALAAFAAELTRIPLRVVQEPMMGEIRLEWWRTALASGDVAAYRISDARIMGYLRNNSIFTFGKADRAKTSATFREILDAMWLFTDKFVRARARFAEIKAAEKGQGR